MDSRFPCQPSAAADQVHRGGLPGEAGIWLFVLGDMIVFALLFGCYIFYRAADVQGFRQSQDGLNIAIGGVNTLLLLTSSLFVVLGVQTMREHAARHAAWLFSGAFACGFGFAVLKLIEYGHKFAAGISLVTSDFYSYYFILTGLHFLHVSVGLCVLVFLIRKAWKGETRDGDIITIESGATYWHMVDLLWIVLFPLLYLMR
jgi:nitric oxide reductase NorE protein